MNNYFPLFVNLTDQKIVVVGAGNIASRRIETLLKFREGFTVIATQFSEAVLQHRAQLDLQQKPFELSDLAELSHHDLVLALTDDASLNATIANHCHKQGILVNVSTDKQLCTFYFPAIVTKDSTVIGITASGTDHKKVKQLRERIASMMEKPVIIGSRESKLAVVQSQLVLDYLQENQISAELLTMKTTGDKILDRTLDKIGGKGLFTKELDRALLEKKSDLSVHSLKDMPMEVDPQLPLLGYSKREDPRDVLILPLGETALSFDKPIGCSSMRRTLQLQQLFPQATFQSVRGNVLTRLEKLDRHEYGALVLAAAGIKRLGLQARIHRYFEPHEILPAAGQGIVVVQGRAAEDYRYLQGFFDRDSAYQATAERAFVKTLNGGCSSPIAAYATIADDQITLEGLYYDEQTKQYQKQTTCGTVDQAYELGVALALEMKEKR